MSIIIFLVSLAVLILVHEFGHFIVAKKSGIRVDEFGLGFPPKIWSKKWGGTLYTLNAIPFGGFVKIFGEDAHSEDISAEDRSRSFVSKPKWIQALVLVAGVSMNIIFAWFLISLGFIIGMPSPTDWDGLGEVKDVRLVITETLPDSPAQKAGLRGGDTIVRLSSGNEKLENEDLTSTNASEFIGNPKHTTLNISYKRGDTTGEIVVKQEYNKDTDRKIIGVAMDEMGTLKLPPHLALVEGARTTYFLTKATVVGLSHFLLSVITFKSDFSQVTGPVGIAGVVGEASELGFVYLLSLVALISINLAIINLLPFPALDGGRLLFVFIEAIMRKPINPVFVRYTNIIGFALLLLLMLVVTTKDILKLF